MKIVILVTLILQLARIASFAAAQPVNGIVAIVGDSVITYKDLQWLVEDDVSFLERRFATQPEILNERVRELERETVELLVENELVLQEFKRAAYVLPESFIQNRIEEDIKKYGDRLSLTKTLQAQGRTFETYKKEVRERVILNLMWQQRLPLDPVISPARVEKYYTDNKDKFRLQDQVRLRMIVLTNKPADVAYSPLKLAEEISAKLKEGIPFEELARIYSQGPNAGEGGDYGWMEKATLNEELAKVAFGMKPGDVSGPVQLPHAVYIIKVEDAKVSYVKTLAEAREEIETILKDEEKKRLRKQWIDTLKTKTFIRYFPF